ncbi:hypothetical protein [Micromonospora sp. WMMA2032]|uniref:hypothetical protein n=1 Tax=Micromonospora sp. WMMA2032 TaxID=2039870 RepID=UPI0020A48E7A|nr:hypothetical protein [Micromonospora sp. WMMA2032]
MPQVTPEPDGAAAPLTLSIAELARTGALQLIGPVRSVARPSAQPEQPVELPVLSARNVVEGTDPSPHGESVPGQAVKLLPGDVVVPITARQLTVRVIEKEDALLGPNMYLLRPNPDALDPWFLAGHLRTSGNERQASSLSGTLRFDIRRAQIRRLPLKEQRAYGDAFRRLAAFEVAVREAASLGSELVRVTADGLAQGVVRPPDGP